MPRLVILLGVPPDESLHLYSLLLRLCCCFAALAARKRHFRIGHSARSPAGARRLLGCPQRSGIRLLSALALAIVVSFPLGVLLGHSKAADWLGAPVTFITLPLPKIVLLPVFFTILGLGDSSRILLIALATGYQILVIVRESALALNPSYELAMRSMGASTAERVLHVYIPAALPSLFMALKAASSTAVAVLFLAESFATDAGLGWYIMNAWGLGDMDGMFVGILGMCVLGVALYAGIGLLERLACPWALQK